MSSEAILEKVRQIVSNLFSVGMDEITAATSYETIEKWDSMGHLMLILEIEQEFDVQLEPEHVERMTNVMAIVQVLEQIPVTVNR